MELNKPFYDFTFIYKDKEGLLRFSDCVINEPVSIVPAFNLALLYAEEYKGRITKFIKQLSKEEEIE